MVRLPRARHSAGVLVFALEDAHALGRKIWNGAVRLARPGERWKLVALGGVMLAGGALRVAALDAPMRYDESYTFQYHASRDVLNLVSDYTTPNNHIFHSLLVHCIYLLWGDSPARCGCRRCWRDGC